MDCTELRIAFLPGLQKWFGGGDDDEAAPVTTQVHYCRNESLQNYENRYACRTGVDPGPSKACIPGVLEHIDKKDVVSVETATITCNDGKVLAKVLTRKPAASRNDDGSAHR